MGEKIKFIQKKFIMKIIDDNKLKKLHFYFEKIILKIKDLLMGTSNRVMIPFDPLSYIFGVIVHTNEFIVKIGGKIFTSLSAFQVISFLRHRQKLITENIQKYNKRENTLINFREVIDHYEPPKLKNITSIRKLKIS